MNVKLDEEMYSSTRVGDGCFFVEGKVQGEDLLMSWVRTWLKLHLIERLREGDKGLDIRYK